jgi:hypothetical protein
VLLAAARIPLLVVDHQDLLASAIQALAIAVPFAGIGVLVARRRPDHVIGWLILAPALFFLLGTDAGLYAAIRYRLGHGLPAGPVAVLLFRPGCPPSRCSRWPSCCSPRVGCHRRGGAGCCGPTWGFAASCWPS